MLLARFRVVAVPYSNVHTAATAVVDFLGLAGKNDNFAETHSASSVHQ
jgi:hypothetical protein